MSGHSRWSHIKRKKGKTDVQRGKLFSKILREITVAARNGGGEFQGQHALEAAMESAKEANMPQENIKRAIQKGNRRAAGGVLRGDHVRGVRAGGVALLIQVLTDNRNRTGPEIRHAFEKFCGNIDPLLQVRLRHGVEVRKEDDAIRYYDAAIKTSPVVLAGGARPARSLPAQRRLAARDPDARAGSQAVDRGQRARRRVRAHRADLRRQARRSGSRESSIRRARSPSTRSACRRTARCSSCTSRAASSSARCRSR